MKARKLIEGATFEPKVLKVVTAAFDAAWSEISPTFGTDPAVIEAARLRLAEAVLSVASEDSCNVDALKTGALQAMALDYRVSVQPRVSGGSG